MAWTAWIQFQAIGGFDLLHIVQIEPGAQRDSYAVGAVGHFSGHKAAVSEAGNWHTSGPQVKKGGAIFLLRHKPKCHSDSPRKHRKTFKRNLQ